MESPLDAPTILFMVCEICGRKTQHFRTTASIMKITFPYTVYRLDYPTRKYRCLECGEVREILEEDQNPTKPKDTVRKELRSSV